MKKILLLVPVLFLAALTHAQLTTTPITNITQTVLNNLVANGINVTNITYTGHPDAIGEFTCVGCDINLTGGVVLTTGSPANLGDTASVFISTQWTTPGDADLNATISAPSYDAAVLEFDYQIATDTVEITFVFGSEEYNEYVNSSFNDVFAFFVSGPGLNNENIALVPGTTTPVAINNVNNGNSNAGATGPCTNCLFYIDNYTGTNVSYDGFTTVIMGKKAATPGAIYHMKIAIADVGDGIFDSGVFIESNSVGARGMAPMYLNNSPTPVQDMEQRLLCPGETIHLEAPAGASVYNWSNGAATPDITVSQSGTYSFWYTFGGNASANSTSLVVISLSDQPVITEDNGVLYSNSLSGNQWYFNGNPIVGATGASLPITGNGSYTVQISGQNCTSPISAPFIVTGVSEFAALDAAHVYYDVTSSEIKISGNLKGTFSLFNILGAELMNSEIKSSTQFNAVKGIYFVRLTSEGKSVTKKIVVE